MKHPILSSLVLTSAFSFLALELFATEPGFTSLSDGKTFAGWKMAEENTNTWQIEEGAYVARGSRCHLFYLGDGKPFKNFDLKVDVMTEPGANGGIYFHTRYQAQGWPQGGFESQVNNTHSDWIKTGSLYGIVNIGESSVQDNRWWTQEIIVEGNKVTVKVDEKIVLQYMEPSGAQAAKDYEHKLGEGTFALQSHPGTVVRYKNIRVKRFD